MVLIRTTKRSKMESRAYAGNSVMHDLKQVVLTPELTLMSAIWWRKLIL